MRCARTRGAGASARRRCRPSLTPCPWRRRNRCSQRNRRHRRPIGHAHPPIAECQIKFLLLQFIGDGFLAVFPCERNQKDSNKACNLARSAALHATHQMAEINRQRAANKEAPLGYGLSLHIGNVMFGNVGLAERLSFSVFGSIVNEAARLAALTKKFATPIVASEEFTTYCGGEWEALGSESLRGINAPMAVFRPAQPEPEALVPQTTTRSRARDFSDAEAVVLVYRDSPS
ncbi:MAG TPA: adenylate/guanylate cyclase domain-containing protein [Stellaceae bacterium]